MNTSAVTTLVLYSARDYGLALLSILGLFLTIAVGYLIFSYGYSYFFNADGSTSRFGSHHPTFDHLTYKPFKGSRRAYWYRVPYYGKRWMAKDMG